MITHELDTKKKTEQQARDTRIDSIEEEKRGSVTTSRMAHLLLGGVAGTVLGQLVGASLVRIGVMAVGALSVLLFFSPQLLRG
jgi:hypothetical protein